MSKPSSSGDRGSRSWLPPASLNAIRQEIGDLYESFLTEAIPQFRNDLMPRVDLLETQSHLEISADVPGFTAEEISVELADDRVILSGRRTGEFERETVGQHYHKRERRLNHFSRSLPLPCPVEEQDVDAQLAGGILKVRLVKKEDGRRRSVPIRSADAGHAARSQVVPTSNSSASDINSQDTSSS